MSVPAQAAPSEVIILISARKLKSYQASKEYVFSTEDERHRETTRIMLSSVVEFLDLMWAAQTRPNIILPNGEAS